MSLRRSGDSADGERQGTPPALSRGNRGANVWTPYVLLPVSPIKNVSRPGAAGSADSGREAFFAFLGEKSAGAAFHTPVKKTLRAAVCRISSCRRPVADLSQADGFLARLPLTFRALPADRCVAGALFLNRLWSTPLYHGAYGKKPVSFAILIAYRECLRYTTLKQ